MGKKGVVRDKPVHMEVHESFINYAESIGFTVRWMTFSPIKGPEGNIEYLGYLGYGDAADIDIKAIVEASHAELDAPKEGEG